MAITQTSDFVQRYKISVNNFSSLDDYIAKFEKEFLLKLMGSVLYDLFIADLSGTPEVPGTARFLSIFNAFNEDDGSCLHESEGIKTMLVQFIYYHYVTDEAFSNTIAGTVRQTNENSAPLGYNGSNAMQAYNEGVLNFRTIQWYINDNITTYLEENMQYLEYESGI